MNQGLITAPTTDELFVEIVGYLSTDRDFRVLAEFGSAALAQND